MFILRFQILLESKDMSKYHLSKISGVPKTTIMDICAGRSSIDRCSAKTVFMLAKALNCTMEYLMSLDTPSDYDASIGVPTNPVYLECGLPDFLKTSLDNMKKSWSIQDSGQKDMHWDLYWCELNADINSAETDQTISAEQAQYLRKTYLRM